VDHFWGQWSGLVRVVHAILSRCPRRLFSALKTVQVKFCVKTLKAILEPPRGEAVRRIPAQGVSKGSVPGQSLAFPYFLVMLPIHQPLQEIRTP
jgi:hypothetical protein